MYHTFNNYRAARKCSRGKFQGALWAPQAFLAGVPGPPSWSAQINKSMSC